VTAEQIVLLDGQIIHLDSTVAVQGQIEVASVVTVKVCVADDGTPTVISIVVIFQLDSLPPTPTSPRPPAPPSGDTSGRVTICLSGGKGARSRSTVRYKRTNGDTPGPCTRRDDDGGDDDGDK
jgi:hypothetical protein